MRNTIFAILAFASAFAACGAAELVQYASPGGERVAMEMQIVCETNIIIGADDICRHEVKTNAYPIYRYPDGREVRFDLEKIEKIWNGMHNQNDGRVAIHGAKGHTVITNGYKYIQYADGYVHQEKMKERRPTPRRSSLLTPFSGKKPKRSHFPPRLHWSQWRHREQAVIDTLSKTNYVNAVFSPGGKVTVINEETR